MISRRMFLQTAAALPAPLLLALTPDSFKKAVEARGKRLTYLHDGGFDAGAWGWQLTAGAAVDETVARSHGHSMRIESQSGDYARFLVCNPRAGVKYTLSGWVRTAGVRALSAGGGAFYAASQFEFQGRPTQMTAEGHIEEQHLGNISGDTDWTRFQQTFECREGTTWIEVAVGLYRAAGRAWFDDLTFVEGDTPAELAGTVEPEVSAQWAHAAMIEQSGQRRPRAAILRDKLPVRGTASDPARLAALVSGSYDVSIIDADTLADGRRFFRRDYDLLVLPYGETFPLKALPAVRSFLSAGGDLITTGGYAFLSPVVQDRDGWVFDDEHVWRDRRDNIVAGGNFQDPAEKLASSGWHASDLKACTVDSELTAARVTVPPGTWGRSADWSYKLPAKGNAKRFYFEARVRAQDVDATQGGWGHVSVQQLDSSGELVYAMPDQLKTVTGSADWEDVRQIIVLSPETVTLRIRFGLTNSTGTLWVTDVRLEERTKEPRINTAKGFPQDQLMTEPDQIGMFDADYRLKRVAYLEVAPLQPIAGKAPRLSGNFTGYAAAGVLGINDSRWIPVLNAYDRYGRLRGAAAALMHNYGGSFASGSWAFFGVDNADLFASGELDETIRSIGRALARKCYLHELESSLACYRDGEPARVQVKISNYGRTAQTLEVAVRVVPDQGGERVHRGVHKIRLEAGQTATVQEQWSPERFGEPHYRVEVDLACDGAVIDRLESGFVVWKEETLKSGGPIKFRENYMQLHGRPMFLQGTDDYVYMFLNRDENPNTWQADAYGCRDASIDIYENLMGLRGPQQNPPREWWRWIDAMLLSVQRAGGIFMPGMLIFSNTAVSDADLDEQKAFCRKFAERYREAPGLIYYLNGDLELHDPNLSDLQLLYRNYLREKYGSEEGLKRAWYITPPEAPLDALRIVRGVEDLRDLRSLDDYEFRTSLVARWLGSLSQAIRQVDHLHPITAEFYQSSQSGIDLRAGSGSLDFANFGYFDDAGIDRRRFPAVLKFLDQSLKGKGAHVGEFGVKTHPGWQAATSYIQARSESYEQDYFLELTHTAFGQGGTKVQNWSWKYPADLPFEWGINYPCDSVARDVRACYRNAGFLFHYFRPKYEAASTVFLIPEEIRKGGQGDTFYNGLMNSIQLLIDARVAFQTLEDTVLEKLPPKVGTIFYPLAFAPSDATLERLERFVREGGQLYLSGDVSYDSLHRRTRTDRLERMCGVKFEQELYPGIAFETRLTRVEPTGVAQWPVYSGAPCMRVQATQATVLAATRDQIAVVVEHRLGKGRVIFTTDPFELHAPASNPDGRAFYSALLNHLGIAREELQPSEATVHLYRLATLDGETIHVAVNYGDQAVEKLRIPVRGRMVSLTVPAHRPALIAVDAQGAVPVVEGMGEMLLGEELLLNSTAHLAAMAADRRHLGASNRLILLPMGSGVVEVPNVARWRNPRVIAGAVEMGRWHTFEQFTPASSNGRLKVEVDPDRNLSMLLLCEAADERWMAERVVTQLLRPWDLPTAG